MKANVVAGRDIDQLVSSYREKWNLVEILRHVNFNLFARHDYFPAVDVENVIILAHFHCLTSNYDFIRHLVENVGVQADHIFVLPKPYSTIPVVVRRLAAYGITVLAPNPELGVSYDASMNKHISKLCALGHTAASKLISKGKKPRVVLIDDGGFLTQCWCRFYRFYRSQPIEMVSIQQTASGVWRLPKIAPFPLPFPVINVAQSAAKRKFEGHIIANGIANKVAKLQQNAKTIGIAGFGTIGKALAKRLVDDKRTFFVFDLDANYDGVPEWVRGRIRHVPDKGRFLQNSDLIFGCTGKNWLCREYLRQADFKDEKTLVSCSSRDVEFMHVLQLHPLDEIDKIDRFDDVIVPSPKGLGRYVVRNGGFPINFDRSREWEPSSEIALTRMLILMAILQALCIPATGTFENTKKLDPDIQKHLTLMWLKNIDKTATDFGLQERRIGRRDWWVKWSEEDLPKSDNVRIFPTKATTRQVVRRSAG